MVKVAAEKNPDFMTSIKMSVAKIFKRRVRDISPRQFDLLYRHKIKQFLVNKGKLYFE